ncbi:MAG: hypothetical protein RL684_1866 [Pseudomonadota bacterium]|jgi:hypothetical protein
MGEQTQKLKQLKESEASAIAAAATQIELALHEAHEPVEDLGLLIGQISTTLAELRDARRRSPIEPGESVPGVGEVDAAIGRLETALHGSIERLQFYDSMVQHLSHVRDYLAGVATQLAQSGNGAEPPPTVLGPRDAESWERLRHQLRTRLLSDSQRELLDLVMPATRGARAAEVAGASRATDGNVELF